MERFTWNELKDMHMTYVAARGEASEARRVYNEWFPSQTHTMSRDVCWHQPMSVRRRSFPANRHNTSRRRSVCTPEFNEEILRRNGKEPSTSTR
ncbi:hypothetical protein ANN_11078 [Periplaneta americana]|uniref:Uncharacterized protein n=1 Tax=Periplaneta americana TaxID=6978 RepID=A0ABQ8T5N8_PERAM|nr:hypothetical protein ANN_11078 [Periplaneta americana]